MKEKLPRRVSPPFEANLYTHLFNRLLYRQLQPYDFLKTEFYQRHLNAITTVGDPSLALFWLAKHVIIFLLIPGDPSLATFAEASVAETLGMTSHYGVKEEKEVAIRTAIATWLIFNESPLLSPLHTKIRLSSRSRLSGRGISFSQQELNKKDVYKD